MQTVLAYRQRLYGLTETQAHDQHAATELGRLWLAGDITEHMREAGERYLAVYSEYQRALKTPVGLRKTNAAGDGGDITTDEYVTWAIGAVMRWDVFKMPSQALQMVVIEDKPCGGFLAELRMCLTALAKRFGVEALAKAVG